MESNPLLSVHYPHGTKGIYPGNTTKIKLMMMFKKGWQKIMSRMNAVHNMQHVKYPHSLGPHSSAPKTKGFHDHLIRPTGGGRKGLELGSLRAAPDGMAMDFSLGQICREIATFEQLSPEEVKFL